MAKFGDTPFGVEAFMAQWDAFSGSGGRPMTSEGGSRLADVAAFGANPGALGMLAYAPPGLKPGAPLVVVLHGCTQDAAGYDSNAGWTALADEAGFAVLYPEQKRSNNAQGCFNWFLPADSARGLGESRSIREMIATMVKRHRIDERRIFVTGLSAGGAMAAALLADYPDVFAGGAVIAGLPCGAAASMGEAFEAMARPRERTGAELGDLVRAGSRHKGPWPTISIWHGGADRTVTPKNADALVRQWLNVHGAPEKGFREEAGDGFKRRVWQKAGRDVVELHLIDGMGHGTPLDGRMGERSGPFMLDVGLSSTRRIAAFWGVSGDLDVKAATVEIAKAPAESAAAPMKALAMRPKPAPRPQPAQGRAQPRAERPDPAASPAAGASRKSLDVGAVINRALKAAGLMR